MHGKNKESSMETSLIRLQEKVIDGEGISEEEALFLASIPSLNALFQSANTIKEFFRGKRVDLCSIVNAKSGGCAEDCAYCAQSARYKAEVETYPLMNKETILKRAEEAKSSGAGRFCIVTSGRNPTSEEMQRIASAVRSIRQMGLLPCATLGLLNEEDLVLLKKSGLERYHHNLETSEQYFEKVCTTHTYEDKLETIEAVKSTGLSLCSGGIFGMGETWQDRIRMAFSLKMYQVDSVPINFLIPIEGTPLGKLRRIHPGEALRIISIYRFILPSKEIRLCGGRIQTLGNLHAMVYSAGADGLLIGNYLTREGPSPADDLNLIRAHGLSFGNQ
jgi:biotin synthase